MNARDYKIRTPRGTQCTGIHLAGDSAVRGIYVHGFRSSIAHNKAEYFCDHADARGYDWVNVDLPCHGKSDGAFRAFLISDALAAVLEVIHKFRDKPVALIASSMGAWLCMLAARKLAADARVTIAGAVLIAPAFDFVREYLAQQPAAVMQQWQRDGVKQFTDEDGGEHYELDYAVVEDGLVHGLLAQSLAWDFPVEIFHGAQDEIVPIDIARRFCAASSGAPVKLHAIPDGDHALNESLPEVAVAVDELLG